MMGSACRAVTLIVHILLVMIVLGTGAERASAQAALGSDRAAKAMPDTYSDPPCELKGSHYKVTAANGYLKNAIETEEAGKRGRELQKGKEILLEALQKNKQDQSSTAWFALARIHLYQGDVAGADSALRRAEAISPKCAGAIEGLRYMVWAPLINAGVEFSKAQANDSALALFRQAAAIYPEKPQAMRPVHSSRRWRRHPTAATPSTTWPPATWPRKTPPSWCRWQRSWLRSSR